MKKAKVSELKARLSSYLAAVKKGDAVVVCERQTPIAHLVPYMEDERDFRISEASQPIGKLGKIRPIRTRKKIDAEKVLQEMRRDS